MKRSILDNNPEVPAEAWSVLIVEDDISVSAMTAEVLKCRGMKSITCWNVNDADQAILERKNIGAAIVDLGLPDGNGLDLVRRTRKLLPELPIFILTANDTVESAVIAMKAGVLDYFTKPFQADKLLSAVSGAMEVSRVAKEGRDKSSAELKQVHRWKSAKMRHAIELARRAGESRSPVLITGARNVGKGAIARMIHQLGVNRNKPFLILDAATLPAHDLEKRLFGRPADQMERAGQFASGGRLDCGQGTTIYLENVESLRPAAQIALLGWLHASSRSAGEKPASSRLVAASTTYLPKLISEGSFSEDLWYALAVHHVEVPGLAERQVDIPLLCEDLITRICLSRKINRPSLTRKALEAILDHKWPGNLGELERVMELSISHTHDRLINLDDLPRLQAAEVTGPVLSGVIGNTSIEELNKVSLIAALDACGGNRRRAAKRLNVSLRTVYNMIKRHDLTDDIKRVDA